MELEERYTQQKCYEFDMSIAEFGGGTRGVKEAARLYYNKSLRELTEREILELNMIKIAPYYYSPWANPTNLKKAVDAMMNGK